jgi:hypothetical protein
MSIEAMKQALEALETLNSGDSYKTHNAATALRQAIEQEEKQEPVGYVSEPGSCTEVGTNSGVLHTEWVGLKDEEVGGLTVFDGLTHIEVPILADFVRAIEAKLKERNS